MGQIMTGDPVGSKWQTDIFGVTREISGETYKLAVGQWEGRKAFVTDIGKYKWLFLGEVKFEKPVPSGAMVARGPNLVGMFLNKLIITGGKENVVYGRCAMSSEIARFLSNHGIDTSVLYNPPAATVKREDGADAAFQLLARIYSLIGAGMPALAADPARELVKLRPKDAQARLALGVALVGSGKFEDSIKEFDEASKIEPALATIRTNRALALVALKKTAEAEAELLKAAEEAPFDIRPISALADFYAGDEKTLEKALTYANKALSMAPNSPAGMLLVARTPKRMKKYEAAIKLIKDAIKLAPNWAPAYYALGSTSEESGDKDSAEKAYRKLVEIQPKNPDSLMTLASFLADTGKKDEAVEFIAKVRDLNPPQPILDAAKALEDKIKGAK
jgi:tetratricopeptide (TPR) repeat protein